MCLCVCVCVYVRSLCSGGCMRMCVQVCGIRLGAVHATAYLAGPAAVPYGGIQPTDRPRVPRPRSAARTHPQAQPFSTSSPSVNDIATTLPSRDGVCRRCLPYTVPSRDAHLHCRRAHSGFASMLFMPKLTLEPSAVITRAPARSPTHHSAAGADVGHSTGARGGVRHAAALQPAPRVVHQLVALLCSAVCKEVRITI